MCSEDYSSCFVILSVCLSVFLSVCLSICLSVTTFSATTSNKTANKRYEWVQCHTGFILKIALESYGVKQSEEANMPLAYLDQLCVPWRHQKLQCSKPETDSQQDGKRPRVV